MPKRNPEYYKQIQEEMRALAQFPDENPNPIFRVDPKGTILYANSASLHLLYSWDCEMGTALPEAFQPAIQTVLATGYTQTIELENQGRIYSFLVVPVSRRNFAYLYGQDITERKRLDQLKDDFISAVSHELRIPLTIVKGAISNLQEGIAGPLKPEQLKVMEVASRNITRLTRLINELLDLSRLESGKARLNQTRMDAAALIKQAEKDFKLEAEKRGLLLHSHLPAKLPAVYADSELIHQVFSNLLDNALRFAKHTIVVEAQGTDSEGMVTFRVCDDGKGIPLEHQKRLFSKFYQVERVVAAPAAGGSGYRGTGLGLSIAKEIVERHGGKIWVESVKNQGTTFCFTLASYHKEKDFQLRIQEAMVKAQENKTSLAVLGLRFKNGGDLQTIQAKIQGEILRGDDICLALPEKGVLVILTENNREGAEVLHRRLLAKIRNHACKISLTLYPEDTTNPEHLFDDKK